MPQPTAINFWKTNRRQQEESGILRETFQKGFPSIKKTIARAKATSYYTSPGQKTGKN